MFNRWRTSCLLRDYAFWSICYSLGQICSLTKWLSAWEENYLAFNSFKMLKLLYIILLERNIRIPNTIFLLKFVNIDVLWPCLSVAKCSRGMTELKSLSGWWAQLVLLPNFSMGGSRCLVARGPLVPNFSQFKLETKMSSLP